MIVAILALWAFLVVHSVGVKRNLDLVSWSSIEMSGSLFVYSDACMYNSLPIQLQNLDAGRIVFAGVFSALPVLILLHCVTFHLPNAAPY